MLCIVGFLIAAISLIALRASWRGVSDLVDWWDKNKSQNYFGPDIFARRSRNEFPHLRPWNFFPILFCLSWLTFFIIKLIL